MNKLFVMLLMFCWRTSAGFAQKSSNLDDSIQSEIKLKTQGIKRFIESNEMNPGMKSVASEFAIDTFKIEYYQRRKLAGRVNLGTMVSVTKYVTAEYINLLDKYYLLAIKMALPGEKKILVAAQVAWGNFRKKEAILLSIMYEKSDVLHYNYLMTYQMLIQERAMSMAHCFMQLKENNF